MMSTVTKKPYALTLRYRLKIIIWTGFATLSLNAQTDLAPTPPMGWNSWNHFAGKVTDADVRTAADFMVSSGMRDASYVYVNIDDKLCAFQRTEAGHLLFARS